jgi:anti-sigma factor RsiW
MAETDDRLERLIGRRLDGEITEAEEHELNKMLIRSPEARRLSETCERQDGLLGSVLREDLGGIGSRAPTRANAVRAFRGVRGWRRSAGFAAAAAVVLAVGAAVWLDSLLAGNRAREAVSGAGDQDVGVRAASPIIDPVWASNDGMDIPHERRRATNHDLFGVVGEDGKTVYLLELGHTRTTLVPRGGEL